MKAVPAAPLVFSSLGGMGGRLRLRSLVMIRWIALIGQAAALSLVHFGLGFDLPMVPAMAIVMLSGALNVALSMTRPSSAWIGDREAAVTLALDLLQLAALLWLTGGLQNPFAVLILAPVAVSAWILSRRSTLALSAFAVILVSLLAHWYLPLPWPEAGLLISPLYLMGMWAALVIGIVFIASYVAFIARETHGMSQALSAVQAALAREQQLNALGGLAAAAAHELGSPLSTITVVTRELEREVAEDDPLREDIELLRAEAERCRKILAGLAERPEEDAGRPYTHLPLTALVEAAAKPHIRDGVDLQIIATPFEEQGDAPPTVARNPEVLHGLGNLIQNALQFARERAVVTLGWDQNSVTMEIADDGPATTSLCSAAWASPTIQPARGIAAAMSAPIWAWDFLLHARFWPIPAH